MGTLNEEQSSHQDIDQHETSLNLAISNQSKRNEEDISLQKEWNGQELFTVTVETSWGSVNKNLST